MLPASDVHREKRIEYFKEMVLNSDYDIICTQEFFSSVPIYSTKADTIKYFRDLGYHVSECPGAWKGSNYSIGSFASIGFGFLQSGLKALSTA